ncbi:hypothetical protein [Kibdelosporangium philippinense]|uniref:hypothetical protein n=1 Tax=Kibdelosporangium philippinense TaxID=211113 RepID=UPI0036072454
MPAHSNLKEASAAGSSGRRNRCPDRNRAGHEDNFSGKRRRAGLNIQVAADTEGGCWEYPPLPGSMHDRKAFAECDWEDLLAETSVIGDPPIRHSHDYASQKAKGRRALGWRQGEQ